MVNETTLSALNSQGTSVDTHNTGNTQTPIPENWLGQRREGRKYHTNTETYPNKSLQAA